MFLFFEITFFNQVLLNMPPPHPEKNLLATGLRVGGVPVIKLNSTVLS